MSEIKALAQLMFALFTPALVFAAVATVCIAAPALLRTEPRYIVTEVIVHYGPIEGLRGRSA